MIKTRVSLNTMNKQTHSQLHQIGERLKKEYNAQQVILFSSCARGEKTVDSDVDLLVVAPTNEGFLERMATVKRTIRDLRKGLAVAPIVLTHEEIEARKQIRDPFITEILKEGLTL